MMLPWLLSTADKFFLFFLYVKCVIVILFVSFSLLKYYVDRSWEGFVCVCVCVCVRACVHVCVRA